MTSELGMRAVSIANLRVLSRRAFRRPNLSQVQLSTVQPLVTAKWASTKARQWSTPLAESLAKAITVRYTLHLSLRARETLGSSGLRQPDRFPSQTTCGNVSLLRMADTTPPRKLRIKISSGRLGTLSHLRRYHKYSENWSVFGLWRNG